MIYLIKSINLTIEEISENIFPYPHTILYNSGNLSNLFL